MNKTVFGFLVMAIFVLILGVCLRFGFDLAWSQSIALAAGLRFAAVLWRG